MNGQSGTAVALLSTAISCRAERRYELRKLLIRQLLQQHRL